jgi:hypothetical protein
MRSSQRNIGEKANTGRKAMVDAWSLLSQRIQINSTPQGSNYFLSSSETYININLPFAPAIYCQCNEKNLHLSVDDINHFSPPVIYCNKLQKIIPLGSQTMTRSTFLLSLFTYSIIPKIVHAHIYLT